MFECIRSDDSSAYRSLATVNSIKKLDSPLHRLRSYLESLSPPLWSESLENSTKAEFKTALMKQFSKSEKENKPKLMEMFGGVFGDTGEGEGDKEGLERPLREQKVELQRLVRKWGGSKLWKKELEKFEGGKEGFLKA